MVRVKPRFGVSGLDNFRKRARGMSASWEDWRADCSLTHWGLCIYSTSGRWDLFSRCGRFSLARTSPQQGRPMRKPTPWRERERLRLTLVTGAAQGLGGTWPLTPCQPGDWLSAQALGTAVRDPVGSWLRSRMAGLMWRAAHLNTGEQFQRSELTYPGFLHHPPRFLKLRASRSAAFSI